ncbi:MAG: biotin/lipoyl-binding protein, partial [Acidobacteria bacterium]
MFSKLIHSKGIASIPVLIGLALLPGCAREQLAAKREVPPPLPVATVTVAAKPLEHRIEITGTLVSIAMVDIKTETQGRLLALPKEEGDYVQKGELVAQQDETNARLGLQQAEANLETVVAALERVKVLEDHARV